jgi:butyrate kinase
MYRIFTLSPGSTSTKLGVFEDDQLIFKANVKHDPEKIKSFAAINDQLPFRVETILQALEEEGISLSEMDAFSAYSGGLVPTVAGIFPVNAKMLEDTRNSGMVHPAILGSQIIHEFSELTGKPAFLVNPPDSDEFTDLAHVTGIKGLYRESRVHVLNQKEVAIRYAKELGKPYKDCRFVVAHIGGGLSVTAQKDGKIVDGNDVLNGSGPMAPNRSGNVPAVPIVRMCFSGKHSEAEMIAMIQKTGGLLGHLGTDDSPTILDRMDRGDKYAKLIYDAMIYQLAKDIGAYAVVLEGKVDGIILTGGISRDPYVVDNISSLCDWIAPIKVYGGDFEMEALASGAIRALTGEEEVLEYTGVPVFQGFEGMENYE